MDTRKTGAATLLVVSLVASCSLSGCVVYSPPYGAYGAYDARGTAVPYYPPYGYGGPVYLGPPVSLDFGFYGRYGGRGRRGWH